MKGSLGLTSGDLRLVLIAILSTIVAFALYKIVGNEVIRSRLTRHRKANGRDAQGFVRRTDLMRLSAAQEKQRNQANELLDHGRVVEAAQIFESINLHREAVEALEHGGCIEEACAVLLRLQRPNRAAAVFARHSMYAQAGECFLLANMPEDAARAFMEAAREDTQFFERAGRIYESVPNPNMALKAYALGKKADRVVGLAFQTQNWLMLAEFMYDRESAKAALEFLNSDQLKLLIEGIPINQRTVQGMAVWSDIVRNMDLIGLAISKLLRHRQWLAFYWTILKPDVTQAVVRSIAKGVSPEPKDGQRFLIRNAHALYEAKLYTLAAELYAKCKRYAIVAKCFALAGELERCREALDLAQDESLLDRFEETIRATAEFQVRMPPGSWHPEVLKAVLRTLEHVDPYNEEQAAKSPFAMVA